MTDVYEMDRQRILGIKRGAEVVERARGEPCQLKNRYSIHEVMTR